MKKPKSKSSYTNKWLSKNKHFWHEGFFNGIKIIILDKNDAPKIVKERIKEINHKRIVSGKHHFSYSTTDELLAAIQLAKKAKEKIPPFMRRKEKPCDNPEEVEEEEKYEEEDDIDYDEYDEYYDDEDD